MTCQLQDSFVEDGVGVDVNMLRHRELRGGADAGLLAEVQEGLHAAGAVVALGVDRGDVVVARLEDQVHHDAGLEVRDCKFCQSLYFFVTYLVIVTGNHAEKVSES